eukprot:CAMPEP_0203845742 /NCGR_PEP_ID=MMETSP0359-20131031/4005_1 /ASSEMBLY_ACC=CAM_ASM_000338 /TAXON_ID=268821 /ORGANISM="Scrippsiella Hangoei, Strain SHTV-5" /LENGTH=49 /DNA_ID= /DNA_START= /DNA_END= /DNA_ORIENTATION=
MMSSVCPSSIGSSTPRAGEVRHTIGVCMANLASHLEALASCEDGPCVDP